MIYTDRSRMEQGFKCPRKRYWNYTAQGGLVPVGESPDLWFGKLIHGAVEEMVTGRGVPQVPFEGEDVTADGFPVQDEWGALANGLVLTFRDITLPAILADYEWISAEQEMVTPLHALGAPDVSLMSRLDGVLRRRSDGLYFVLEAKTSSWPSELMTQTRTNFQLLLECEALRRTGVDVGGAILLVFDKGKSQVDKKSGGFRRLSPFTYVYTKTKANGEEQFSLDWKSGWNRVPTWTLPGWYETLLERWPEVVREQVQVWPSIDFDPVRVESVIRQIVAQERRLASTGHVDEVWPQNFANCKSDGGFRKQCPYFDLCFSPQMSRDPIGSGEFKTRVPNHPIEGKQ